MENAVRGRMLCFTHSPVEAEYGGVLPSSTIGARLLRQQVSSSIVQLQETSGPYVKVSLQQVKIRKLPYL